MRIRLTLSRRLKVNLLLLQEVWVEVELKCLWNPPAWRRVRLKVNLSLFIVAGSVGRGQTKVSLESSGMEESQVES